MAEFAQSEIQNDNQSEVELISVSVECPPEQYQSGVERLPERNQSGVECPSERNQSGEEPLPGSVERPQQKQSRVELLSATVRCRSERFNQSATARRSTNQSRKFISQVAFILFAASLALLLAIVEGLDENKNVDLGDTISFKVFIVTGIWGLLCSLVVAMIPVTDPQMPEKITWSILMAAAACFLSAFLAAGYIVKIAVVKWIAVSSCSKDYIKFKSEVLI